MYLTFLFAVMVVLLNLLIAQMSDTYTKVQEDVEGTFAIARARIIARLQRGKWLLCKEVKIHHCTCRCVYPYAYVYVAVKLNVKVMCCLVTLLLAVIQEALLQEVRFDRLVRFAVAIFV